jgi:hypothetical protein
MCILLLIYIKMKCIKLFENFSDSDSEKPKERPERKARPEKKDIKRCIGQCERKFFLKDGKPVVYCPSCDRILN